MIRDEIEEVLALQLDYSSSNTPEMERRGIIIRREIKERLTAHRELLSEAFRKTHTGELSFEGRDGSGSKTYIPWHRIYVDEHSPSAQIGWYVVFLFKADGSGVYLCLSHGSTDGAEMRQRPAEELAGLVQFARHALASQSANDDRLIDRIDFDNVGDLGRAYEKSVPFAYFYSVENLPDNDTIAADTCRLLEWLGVLYTQIELGRVPDAPSSETQEVLAAASPMKNFGQGRGLNAKERRAVELRAMDLATAHLKTLGFRVTDVSKNHPYDLKAVGTDQTLVVEVKGTTGSPNSILMTANEIELHLSEYPNTALVIVSGIDLDRGSKPRASGGRLDYVQPWAVPEDRLRATTYEVKSPLGVDQWS